MTVTMMLYKILITVGLTVPVLVLYKVVVNPQVGHQPFARCLIMGNKAGRNATIHCRGHHAAHHLLVGVKFLALSALSLKEAIVALTGKDAVCAETTLGKLSIDICSEDEIIFLTN